MSSCFAIAQEISATFDWIIDVDIFMSCLPSTQNETCGSSPTGWRMEPLIYDPGTGIARLSMCFPSAWTNWGPAAHISAPESGKILKEACPWHVDTCMLIVGADSWANPESRTVGSSFMLRAWALGVTGVRYWPEVACLREHTLAKCHDLPQFWQVWLTAGHFLRTPSWKALPHPGQVPEWVAGGRFWIYNVLAASNCN